MDFEKLLRGQPNYVDYTAVFDIYALIHMY